MNFHFRHDDPHTIWHDATNEPAGCVTPLKRGTGFSLHSSLTNSRIATIGALDEAIAKLAAYCEAHPPRWRRKRVTRYYIPYGNITLSAYVKWTFYGYLSVEREEPGRWTATRYTDPLVDYDGEAIFATSDEAMRAADRHMYDGFNSEPINDGFSWYRFGTVWPVSKRAT